MKRKVGERKLSKMLIGILACICSVSLACAQNNLPYSYRGEVLGTTSFKEFTEHLSPKEFGAIPSEGCFSPAQGIRRCSLSRDFDTSYIFVDEMLASVTFSFEAKTYLNGFIQGLTEKFGTPVKTTAHYQNGFGAKYTGDVWNWTNAVGGIRLESRENTAFGTVVFYDSKLLAALKARGELKPKL